MNSAPTSRVAGRTLDRENQIQRAPSRAPGIRWLVKLVLLVGLLDLLAESPAVAAGSQMLYGQAPPARARVAQLDRLPKTQHLNLSIALPLRNQMALTSLLHSLGDPASPSYRHYLSPAQFTAKFGPTQKDYQAVINFAKAKGLKVTGVHANRMLVDVEGAVPNIEKAFHLKMWSYRHPSEARKFYAPDRDPSVDLAVPILGVSGLDNYELPRPRFKHANIMVKAYASANGGTAPNGDYIGSDFRNAYAPGVSLTGTGQTIGMLEFDGYTASDIAYYESKAGLPNVPLTNVLLDGFSGTPTGDGGEVEVSLDIEVAVSMAQGASGVLVYEAGPSGSWHDILNRMATDNLAKQLSCSWYIPSGAADATADQIFQEMAAQGQSFFAASGDSDAYTGLIPFPGDTPYITEVGGTMLTTASAGGSFSSEQVWNEGSGIGSGGGISTQYAIPSWQQGISMTSNLGSTTMRNTPDVALTADNVYVRADGEDYNVGGTSCAAPLWAGFTALVNQQAVLNTGATAGFVNPAVYALAQGANYTSSFHDTTVGNNFSSSSPAKFPAVTGYDLCTGWGTPSGSALINALAGPPTPTITTGSPLASGVVGSAYTETFTASGGTPGYSWSISSGSLPQGLSLASGGVLGGSPTATGTATFTVQVTDSNNISSTAPFSLTIYPQGTPIITTSSPLAAGTVGTAYGATIQASGGTPPYTWTLGSGSLPLGLSLTNAGVITGTPTASGTSIFTVQVTDSNSLSSTAQLSLTINPLPVPPTIITTSPLPASYVGSTYSDTLAASGGTYPYTWAVIGGSLPAGLSLSTSGVISGTPTYTGTSSCTVQVTGSNGASSSAPFTLTVYPQGTLQNGSFETGSFSGWITSDLADPFVTLAVRGNGYSPGYGLFSSAATDGIYSATCGFDGAGPGTIQIAQDIAVNATTPTLAFDYRAGWDMLDYTGSTLPRTFSLVIEPQGGGSPLQTLVQLTAHPQTKTLDTGPQTGVVDLSAYAGTTIRICFQIYVPQEFTGPGFFELDNVRFEAPAPPTITTTSPLPSANLGAAYTDTLTATGAATPYTWSIVSGSVPSGLTLSNAGVVSGTPTNLGPSNFTVQCLSANGLASTGTFSLTVLPAPPVINSLLAATGTVGGTLNYQITATNNPTSFGAIPVPSGLSFSSSTGLLSGTPTQAGQTSVTISATNSGGTGSAILTLTVDQGPAFTDGPPPAATINTAYSFAYTASGFPAPTYAVTSGALPPGLSLSSGGVISGAPTATGVYAGTVTASNGIGTAATQNFSIMVKQPPAFTDGPPPAATLNIAYSFTYSANGNPAPAFNLTSGAFPPGLSLSTSGVLSGTPTASGTYTGVVTASNGVSPSATQSFLMNVVNLPPATPVASPQPPQTLGTSTTVAWTAATGAAQYDVQASTSPTFTNPIDSGWLTGTSYTFNNLSLGTTYFYRVRARSSSAPDSTWSQSSPSDFSVDNFSSVVSGTGNLIVLDYQNNTVRILTPAGVVTTFAGLAGVAGSTDGTGSSARFNEPAGAAFDPTGNMYVTDTINNTVRKITPAGVVTTLAGSAGSVGSTDGTGSAARFYTPWGIVVDASGNFFVDDRNNYTIRKMTQTGVVTTFVGTGGNRGSADGTGAAATFGWPTNIAMDSSGNFYVTDQSNCTIRKITSAGVVTTLAGAVGVFGTKDGTGSGANFNNPSGITCDASGNLFVTDNGNSTIRKVTPAGVVTTFAGAAGSIGSVDGTGTAARFYRPAGISIDSTGNLYVADSFNETIRKITPAAVVTTLAGSPQQSGSADGTGSAARFSTPNGMAVSPSPGVTLATSGTVYVSSGTLVSAAISPGTILGWGYLTFTDVSGTGTALAVDLLTPNGTVLASNVASGTDLSTIPALAGASSIELRADFSTSNSSSTPVLSNWSVSYYTNSLSGWSTTVSTTPTAGIAPDITNGPASVATLGTAYYFAYTASGFPAPTFAVTSGALPLGLTLSPSGVLSGTPMRCGTYTGIITASNGIGSNFDQGFSITIPGEDAVDTPTMPPWALALLGCLIVATAAQTRRIRHP